MRQKGGGGGKMKMIKSGEIGEGVNEMKNVDSGF